MAMTVGRAVVIGSGLSGVSTAILLAEDGWQVDILERHSIPGGLMQRYRRGDCRFDTGFHLLSSAQPGGVLRAILARLGTLEQTHFLAPDPQAQFVMHLPGELSLAVPPGLAGAQAAASQAWPEQGPAIARFFNLLRARLAANPYLSNLAEGQPLEAVDPSWSVDQVLLDCGVEGPARTLLGSAASILAMRAESCPFDLYAAFAGSSFAGAWRVADGGDGLMGPLLARAQGLGARLHRRCPAERIEHDGQRVSLVQDGRGGQYPCDLVVAACHPDEVWRLVGDDGLRPSFKARLQEVPDSDGAVLLAARLDSSAEELGRRHHLLRLADGGDVYLVAPDRWQEGIVPCLEAMLWVPVDQVAAFRQTRLGARNPAYEAWKQSQEERLRTAIEERFPRVAASITKVWTASPLTFRDYLGGRHGGAMGLSHHLGGGLADRPLSPRSKLRNLLFTGQSVHHPGILGSLVGGCVTAGAILGRNLTEEVLAHR
ncbi:MAG: NAD(P)/FAD-dependent oxidoreductase [Planctomycetota bacterium]|nr:MAG: NAD(P)/FAD-dependent oxidoreductase [Planctomycetota bacterium]